MSNILRTKWEIVWLGVLAVLWTCESSHAHCVTERPLILIAALAGYTTSPAAKDSEVECWEEDENGNIVDDDVQGCQSDNSLFSPARIDFIS